MDDLLRVRSAQRAVLRRARYDRSCEVGALERLTKCFESGQVQAADQDTPTRRLPSSARQRFTTCHRACAHLPVLHLLIRYELQRVVAHAEQRERRPAIESAPALVVGYRAGPACRAHDRQ